MAIRSDITIDWYASPRIIEIAAPSTNVTLQDLHDTLAHLQDTPEGAQFPDLVASGGKLGGGVTGIATTMLNAEILFQPRTAKLETGTVTTPDTSGRCLIDSTALFATNGVSRGDMALNAADGSHSTVLEVVSETELNTLVLAGGIDNQWDSGDAYEIFDYEFCDITGGDIFAVDEFGGNIRPVITSFGVTGPIIEQDTSPAAAPLFSATEQAMLTLIRDILEADEDIDPDRYRRLRKGTLEVLVDKIVTPTQTGRELDLTEPP